MSRDDYLFHQSRLSDVLREQERKMKDAAQVIPADHALASGVEELTAELVERFRIEPVTIDEAARTMSAEELNVDVSGDPSRFFFDDPGPHLVPGTRFTYHLPVSGETDLFKFAPSTFTTVLPTGEVSNGELRISVDAAAPIPAGIQGRLDRTLADIKQYVGWANADVAKFNSGLPAMAKVEAERRRQKVLADQELLASFGVPVRREDAPKTYAAPPVRRSVARPTPAKGSIAQPLEPVLPAEEYDHILDVVRQMGLVLERSPKAFANMGEEDLRQHFLVQLNGQYEGDATGETFNFDGKTDLLIRRDGRNLFIAECKFWGGPKKLIETIDQLLGYTSWRDTKTAIFVFNKNRDLSKVLAQISPTVAAHPNFVREVSYGGETDYRFIIRHRDDPERELVLTILVFEIPT